MPAKPVSPIRVIIASPRVLVRSGLVALIRGQPQMDIVGTVTERPTANTEFDVLLWDVVDTSPRSLPFRFLALLPQSHQARAWLDAGAAGVVLETSSAEELLDALRQVAHGHTYFPPALTEYVLATPVTLPPSSEPLVEPLTDREREILQLLARGLSNKDIAQKLYVSVRTVEGHLANIYAKLQVKSRTAAALWAIRNR